MRKVKKGNKVGGYTRPPIGGNPLDAGTVGNKPPVGGYTLDLGIRPGG